MYDALFDKVYAEVLQALGDNLLDEGVDMDDAELIVGLLLQHERERKTAEGGEA